MYMIPNRRAFQAGSPCGPGASSQRGRRWRRPRRAGRARRASSPRRGPPCARTCRRLSQAAGDAAVACRAGRSPASAPERQHARLGDRVAGDLRQVRGTSASAAAGSRRRPVARRQRRRGEAVASGDRATAAAAPAVSSSRRGRGVGRGRALRQVRALPGAGGAALAMPSAATDSGAQGASVSVAAFTRTAHRRSPPHWSHRPLPGNPLTTMSMRHAVADAGARPDCYGCARAVRDRCAPPRGLRLADMDRRIFGIENEYGVTCTFRGQRRLSPGRGGPLPVPPGRLLGPQQQRLPAQRRPAVPRRGQPPRVRHARVRRPARARRPRQGGRADPRGAARRRRAAPARGGHPRRRLPVQEQHRLRRQLLRLPRELPRHPAPATSAGSPTCSSRSWSAAS